MEKGEMEELMATGPEAEDHRQNKSTVRSVSRDSSWSEKMFVIFVDGHMIDKKESYFKEKMRLNGENEIKLEQIQLKMISKHLSAIIHRMIEIVQFPSLNTEAERTRP